MLLFATAPQLEGTVVLRRFLPTASPIPTMAQTLNIYDYQVRTVHPKRLHRSFFFPLLRSFRLRTCLCIRLCFSARVSFSYLRREAECIEWFVQI